MKTKATLRFTDRTVAEGTECRAATPEEVAQMDPRDRLYASREAVAIVLRGEARAIFVRPSVVSA